MKKENNSKLERAIVPDMTPLKLKTPVGYGVDMVSEVTVKSPTAGSLKKYNVTELSEEYLRTTEGMINFAFSCLPNLADDYKDQLELGDIIKIVERASTFM